MPALEPVFWHWWALGGGQLYFPIEDLQADGWVMDVALAR